MNIIDYDRDRVLEYARTWAFSRNPEYYDFSEIGGDCTNFASQCVYAGCHVMNYTPDIGWYYINADDRAPSWTSVGAFYDFMTENDGVGPFGVESSINAVLPGDIVQLANESGEFYHTLVITAVRRTFFSKLIYVSAHSRDAYNKDLREYGYTSLRFIHIIAARET